MAAIEHRTWSSADICLPAGMGDLNTDFAVVVYQRVCRTDFTAPGFLLVKLGVETNSRDLRRFMVQLKQLLQQIHQLRTGQDLVYLSTARFDQQSTTKLHRDGGPDECFLMLGYESSQIRADVALSDYSKCANDMGLTPKEFLERHNPMFRAGEDLLRPYTTHLSCFENLSNQVLLINNSMNPLTYGGTAWQGVLHTAAIENPSEDLRRVINSTMIAAVPIGTVEPVSDAEQEEFLSTNLVRRRGYDKPDLQDDV